MQVRKKKKKKKKKEKEKEKEKKEKKEEKEERQLSRRSALAVLSLTDVERIKQTELVRRIGVSQGHLSHIERGETEVGAEILLKISQEFGKSIEWLLTGEE